jgi:hypothetical protein
MKKYVTRFLVVLTTGAVFNSQVVPRLFSGRGCQRRNGFVWTMTRSSISSAMMDPAC